MQLNRVNFSLTEEKDKPSRLTQAKYHHRSQVLLFGFYDEMPIGKGKLEMAKDKFFNLSINNKNYKFGDTIELEFGGNGVKLSATRVILSAAKAYFFAKFRRQGDKGRNKALSAFNSFEDAYVS